MDQTTFRTNAGHLIQDDAGVLEQAELDFAVQEAVKRYSKVKKRRVVADIAADGSFDYDLAAPFDPEYSTVQQVEYPAGRREPSIVDRNDWTLYRAPAGTKLRFLADTPKVGETIRVTHTALHEVTAVSTTVPAADHDVIHLVAAALACESLASQYSAAGDSTIMADSVDHKSKAAEYAMRAKRFMALANELLPVPEQGDVAAGGGDVGLADEQGFLTHPHR